MTAKPNTVAAAAQSAAILVATAEIDLRRVLDRDDAPTRTGGCGSFTECGDDLGHRYARTVQKPVYPNFARPRLANRAHRQRAAGHRPPHDPRPAFLPTRVTETPDRHSLAHSRPRYWNETLNHPSSRRTKTCVNTVAQRGGEGVVASRWRSCENNV